MTARRAAALATLALLVAAPAIAQQAGAKLYREPDRLIATPERAPSVEEFVRSLDGKSGDGLYSERPGDVLRGLSTPERCKARILLTPNITDQERSRARNSCLVIMDGRRLPG